jgi:hypothetical protein
MVLDFLKNDVTKRFRLGAGGPLKVKNMQKKQENLFRSVKTKRKGVV